MELIIIIAESLILIFATVAGIIALKMYDFVRGGQLGASWRWLIGAALFFAIMEILEIVSKTGYINFPNIEFAIVILKALLAFFLMFGFISYKKSLA